MLSPVLQRRRLTFEGCNNFSFILMRKHYCLALPNSCFQKVPARGRSAAVENFNICSCTQFIVPVYYFQFWLAAPVYDRATTAFRQAVAAILVALPGCGLRLRRPTAATDAAIASTISTAVCPRLCGSVTLDTISNASRARAGSRSPDATAAGGLARRPFSPTPSHFLKYRLSASTVQCAPSDAPTAKQNKTGRIPASRARISGYVIIRFHRSVGTILGVNARLPAAHLRKARRLRWPT